MLNKPAENHKSYGQTHRYFIKRTIAKTPYEKA